jgi:hypothetical protein
MDRTTRQGFVLVALLCLAPMQGLEAQTFRCAGYSLGVLS